MVVDPMHRQLDAVLRRDLFSFVQKVFGHVAPGQPLHPDWYLRAICYQLERCWRGELRRLIITLPPRHLKSVCASVAFPAFLLGHDPTARIMCGSYSADLAAKFARDCRSVMTSAWYQRLFPGTRLSAERNAESDFMTTARGVRLAVSVGGSVTGRGGNIMIIDDAMKAEDALSTARRASTNNWFDNSMYTRLDNKSTDCMIVIMQRLHIDDLVGHLLAKDEGWEVLNLPAIAEHDERIPLSHGRVQHRRAGDLLSPGREPLPVLEEIKRSLGHFNFSAQYQQCPIPVEGEIVKWRWFRPYDVLPRSVSPPPVIQSWDTAQKDGELNDYSVCTTWQVINGAYYLVDLFRKKLLYPDLRREFVRLQQQWRPQTILVEDRGSGTSLIQEHRYKLPVNLIPIEPTGDKVTRVATSTPPIEAGRVLLPRGAAWLKELQKEVLQFPEGRHDDQLDSIAQFLGWYEQRMRTIGGARKIPVVGI